MEKDNIQKYIKQLQDLDSQLNDEGDIDDEFMSELSQILNGLTKDISRPSLKTKVKFINKSKNPDPEYVTDGSSGFDLRANLDKDQTINEFSVGIIPTGIFVELESGTEIQIRSRSGMSSNAKLFILNSPGTIDSDYRDEIMIILANFSDIPRTIRHSERIAQGVVCPVYGKEKVELIKVDELSITSRNTGKFGHTGSF